MSPPPPSGLVIRASEPGDAAALTPLLNLPGFRFGTARIPFEGVAAVTARFGALGPEDASLVAELEGELVGLAGFRIGKGRRRHAAELGLGVHDAHVGRGIGGALLAALIDVADNWLDLKRLELTVNTDNAAAIALYERFGFEREGVMRAHLFRDGRYADALMMARLKPGFPG